MREKFEWGRAYYDILDGQKVILNNKNGVACFSGFMRLSEKYDTIRIYKIASKPTMEYKDFFLQYVIEMLDLKASFNEEYFEFKSLGKVMKDAAAMSIIRMLWENLGTKTPFIDSPNLLFKRLRDEECPHEDKLEKFCYFYNQLKDNGYFSDGHSWNPRYGKIKSTAQFKAQQDWASVNVFFTTN
jgi:hypothetical protein